jgi:hypothetical protein
VPCTRSPEDGVALGLADLLDHHLLGALGGDASQLGGVDFLLALLGVDLAGIAVDGHHHPGLLAVLFLRGQLQGGFDTLEDDIAVDILLVVHLIHDPQQVGTFHHRENPHLKQKKVGPPGPLPMPPRAKRRSAPTPFNLPKTTDLCSGDSWTSLVRLEALEELGHEPIRRLTHDDFGAIHLLHLAFEHHGNSVPQGQRFARIVGNHYHCRGKPAPEQGQLPAKSQSQRRIDVA